MCGVPHSGADELDVEGRILVRDVGIECRARLVAVAGIDRTYGFSSATSFETLPVGGTGRSVAPVRCELKPMVVVYDLGKRFRIRLISDVPGGDARQPSWSGGLIAGGGRWRIS